MTFFIRSTHFSVCLILNEYFSEKIMKKTMDILKKARSNSNLNDENAMSHVLDEVADVRRHKGIISQPNETISTKDMQKAIIEGAIRNSG